MDLATAPLQLFCWKEGQYLVRHQNCDDDDESLLVWGSSSLTLCRDLKKILKREWVKSMQMAQKRRGMGQIRETINLHDV